MKKLLAISASAVLAFGMFAFGACNDNNNDNDGDNKDNGAVVSGNYQEPTADELNEAIEGIDEEKVFYALNGLELAADLSFSFNANGSSVSASGKVGYKLTADETTLKGAGTANIEYKSTAGSKTESAKYGATVYNDDDYLYAELTGLPEIPDVTANGKIKAKVSYESIFGAIGELPISALTATVEDEVTAPGESIDITAILEMLEEYKATIGLDTQDGLKIKISFTEESFWLLAEEGGSAGAQIVMLKQATTFNTFVFDIYFALDSEGSFSQVSLNLDINAVADGSKVGASGTTEFAVKAAAVVKAYSGTVTLPVNLAADESYIDMSDMLGNIGGGEGYPDMPY